MSDERLISVSRVVAAEVVNGVCAPAVAVLRVLGIALQRPDLDGQAVAALQEDVVRLFVQIQEQVARLDDEVKAKIDAVELGEVMLQSLSNMGRTASAEKRDLMRNVAVNGIAADVAGVAERRLFVQAVAELDIIHIDLLRDAMSTYDQLIDAPLDEMGTALVSPLATRGFVRPVTNAAGYGSSVASNLALSTSYEVTGLGARFFTSLQEPTVE